MRATEDQVREQAAAIARQAQAIADGTTVGPLRPAALRILQNAETLAVWTADVDDEEEI